MPKSETERFVSAWDRIHRETSKVICAAPEDKLDWRPKDDMFTLRELIGHIPQAEDVLARSAIAGSYQKTLFDFANRTAPQIAEMFDAQHSELTSQVLRLTPEELKGDVEFHGRTMRRIALLRFMTEHEIHHRGQLFVYYRLAGINPPNIHE